MDEPLDNAPGGFLRFTDDGSILLINRTMLAMLGYQRDTLAAGRLQDLLSPGSRLFYRTYCTPRLMLHGVLEETFLTLQARDGAEMPVLLSAARRADARPPFTDLIALSMRQRSRLEDELVHARRTADLARKIAREAQAEAERANQAKSAFLASMSHELRTPLNAILGFTGTLLMKLPGPLNPGQERQLETVRRSARHLLALINDILDLARIEAGRMELDIGPVDCAALAGEVVAQLRDLAAEKGLRLLLDTPFDPLAARADRRALSQIVLNLVSNAIKFTDQGEVRLRVSRGAAGKGQESGGAPDLAVFEVIDSGIGISAEDQGRLFQMFARGSAAAAQEREGTGLGLRISQQLAELMGGRITVESELGRGSTFRLALPAG